MPQNRFLQALSTEVDALRERGTIKGDETVIVKVLPAEGERGPRYLLEGHGDKPFLKMNSNNYLGMSLRPEVIEAEEATTAAYGAGPGAVRFISGTYRQHVELEQQLAAFHGREAAMIFSSAYATTLGVLVPLITAETVLISDELNHNCIINAMRLARPKDKQIYRHVDLADLDAKLSAAASSGQFRRAVIVTLGKAFGVNGGYVTGSRHLVEYLRETAPLYIYSNPITPGEAAAASKAVSIVDSPEGRRLLDHLRAMTARFEKGIVDLGYETIPGEHPVVPLMVRDTPKTN